MPEANKELNVDGEIYETVPEDIRVAISYLMKVREKIGITDEVELEGTVKNASSSNIIIRRYALEIYKIWASLFPHEHKEFIENTKFELEYERPVQEALKAGGSSPVAFPMRLSNLFDILIPSVKTQDKRFWLPLLRQIPELAKTNYIR